MGGGGCWCVRGEEGCLYFLRLAECTCLLRAGANRQLAAEGSETGSPDHVRCPDQRMEKHTHMSRQKGKHTRRRRSKAALHTHTSQSQPVCPCHTYKELLRQIHQLPQSDPTPTSSAVGGSWLRPAVAALAASGADPPHFNASDIYLGRTTGGRGGGGLEQTASQRHRWTRIVPHPPPASTLLCVLRVFFFFRRNHVLDVFLCRRSESRWFQ